MIALAVAGMSTAAFAQQTVESVEVATKKYSVETNSFWSNWFIQGNAVYSAFYSSQEKSDLVKVRLRVIVKISVLVLLWVNGLLLDWDCAQR